ncbi:MAG: cupin-like domain-containing protein [Chromatiales bacterium]|nr:cupin-like domain-containing protein [Chromatiales bacterium]
MSGNDHAASTAAPLRQAQSRHAEPLIIDWPRAWCHPRPLTQFLREKYGALRLAELGGSYGWVVRDANRRRYEVLGLETLGDYLDRFEQGGSGRLPYLTHLSIHRNVPALREFLRAPPEFGPNWVSGPRWDRLGGPELFIGQAGTRFAGIHQDHGGVHVGFCQLAGRKRFIIFPPSDGRWLYRYRGSEFPYQLRNSHVRWFAPDAYQRWPLLARAQPQQIVLEAGQALLLPANWWHATESLTDGITWNIRIVNHSNLAGVLGQHLLGLPRGLTRLFTTLGRD